MHVSISISGHTCNSTSHTQIARFFDFDSKTNMRNLNSNKSHFKLIKFIIYKFTAPPDTRATTAAAASIKFEKFHRRSTDQNMHTIA
jgi:hypothetical protein